MGADIIIPFDELPPYHVDPSVLSASLDRTHRWEKRSLDAHIRDPRGQAMYAVIHGGVDRQLRLKSCAYLGSLDFQGYAIGGSLGKTHQELFELLSYTMPALPSEKPTHLLGIGDLASIEQCIKSGIDTFDSSHPTRCARHGLLFTTTGPMKILNSEQRTRFEPIDRHCSCIVCQRYTAAYVHHLFKANELTGYTLATIHNLHFMITLMASYRERIINGEL